MNETDALIQQISARAAPVKRLASPLRRTALWLAVATLLIAIVVASYGLRLAPQDMPMPAALEWIGSLLTGALAAYAVFQVSVPGRSPAWMWLPLPAVALWLGGLGLGCARALALQGTGAFALQPGSWDCASAITLISLPLGLTLLLMVRHAGVVRPAATALLAGLSAAALAAAGVSLFHEGESAWMVLLWHAGAVVALSAASWLSSRRLFAWIGYARR